jgi:hypothetical protein
MANQDLLSSILGRYTQGFRGFEAPETDRDFDTVANQVPSSDLAGSLADAFRSRDTPPFPDMLAGMFGRSSGTQRSGILGPLIATLGPQIAAQILARHGAPNRVSPQGIDPGEAEQVPEDAVREMAQEAERRDPSVMDRLADFYAQHPGVVKTLGALSLGYMLNRLAQRGRPRFGGL